MIHKCVCMLKAVSVWDKISFTIKKKNQQRRKRQAFRNGRVGLDLDLDLDKGASPSRWLGHLISVYCYPNLIPIRYLSIRWVIQA